MLVAVQLPHAGLYALRQQLERDFRAKALGHAPLPFTVLQLLDLEKLLMLHPDREPVESRDNLLLSSVQQALLARYVHRYYVSAQDSGDSLREGIYLDCLYALSINSTHLFELLLPVPVTHGLSLTARPLALLWHRMRSFIISHSRRPLTWFPQTAARPTH